MATGSLTLIAGQEGLGKSTVAYSLAADLTRGRLPGVHRGTAKGGADRGYGDSWAHTIVPRLMAAGADLDLIYRVEAVSVLGTHSAVSLPKDNEALLDAIDQTGAALVLLDPLMSRVAAGLDTHRDQEVRQALEPLVDIADQTGAVVCGLIHFNKTGSSDPLNSVMASKAFTAVARTVNVVVKDTDDETGRRRLFATPKSNLGPDDLPLLAFTITGHEIPTAEGPAFAIADSMGWRSLRRRRRSPQRRHRSRGPQHVRRGPAMARGLHDGRRWEGRGRDVIAAPSRRPGTTWPTPGDDSTRRSVDWATPQSQSDSPAVRYWIDAHESPVWKVSGESSTYPHCPLRRMQRTEWTEWTEWK